MFFVILLKIIFLFYRMLIPPRFAMSLDPPVITASFISMDKPATKMLISNLLLPTDEAINSRRLIEASSSSASSFQDGLFTMDCSFPRRLLKHESIGFLLFCNKWAILKTDSSARRALDRSVFWFSLLLPDRHSKKSLKLQACLSDLISASFSFINYLDLVKDSAVIAARFHGWILCSLPTLAIVTIWKWIFTALVLLSCVVFFGSAMGKATFAYTINYSGNNPLFWFSVLRSTMISVEMSQSIHKAWFPTSFGSLFGSGYLLLCELDAISAGFWSNRLSIVLRRLGVLFLMSALTGFWRVRFF